MKETFTLYPTKSHCRYLLAVAKAACETLSQLGEPGMDYSNTSAGESYYLYLNGKTMRISDHDCGQYRMQEQLQVQDFSDIGLYRFERFFFPERFRTIRTQVGTKIGERAARVKDYAPQPNHETIEHFVSKTGWECIRYRYTEPVYETRVERIS